MYDTFKKLMDERGLTSYRVSLDTGIPQTTLSDWKNGRSKPKVDKLKILADYFGVSLETFVE
jgi:transcriptional regulator with XRE-family HTH domain